MSVRRFECPFCDEDEEQETDDEEAAVRLSRPFSFLNASWTAPPRREEQEALTVSLSGDADLLITDPAGRRIGYDASKQAALNEIPGALENPVLGEVLEEGDGEAAEPEYYLPLDAASRKPYTVTVSGKSLAAAQTFYERALAVKSDSPDVRTDLGNTFFNRKEYARALAEYRKSVAVAPTHVNSWRNIAAAALNLGDKPTAAEAVERLAALDPQNPDLETYRRRVAELP